MSSVLNNRRVNFGYKRTNVQQNHLKLTSKEFLNYEDEQFTDFSQRNKLINKKRLRE